MRRDNLRPPLFWAVFYLIIFNVREVGDAMKSAYDEFNGLMRAFRNNRALEYDKQYWRVHNADERNAHFAEIYEQVENILGKDNMRLLSAYTDSVIALYNTDTDYFYNCGFNDCRQLYTFCEQFMGRKKIK